MQRWFFLEDPNNDNIRHARGELEGSAGEGSMLSASKYPPRKWLFRVRVPERLPDEIVCVTGSIPELGNWQPEKCIPLDQEGEDPEVWSKEIDIPDKKNVSYRYCLCVIIEPGIHVIVRSWETCLLPRLVNIDDVSPTMEDEPPLYGDTDPIEKIDRGWLNKETVIQLKLCNDCLTLWRPKHINRTVYIKVTPISLLKHYADIAKGEAKTMAEALEESQSTDTQDNNMDPERTFTEVATLMEDDPAFKPQAQFGIKYKVNDLLIFQSTVLFPSNVAFLIDLYIYRHQAVEGEPPHHAGFSYLLPTVLKGSEGNVTLPVTSTKHRPLGQIKIDYLVIRPMNNFKCDMAISYARHWKRTRAGLDVGHRGSGSSFKTHKTQNCAEVRENTIASLKNAIEHGADYVEFDVQLSKDLVPIIYHDFHVCISMRKKKDLEEMDMLELPVKELTYEQLRLLKVYHLTEGKSKNPRFFDEELEEHQPFPTLEQVLDVLTPYVGFNIEIKWTMQLMDGSYELHHPTDLNLYLDTILEVVLRHGGERRIVFSCFNPDVCSMIRMKQNKYPVMFLTIGESVHYPQYMDPRCWSVKAAVQYALMIEMLGINVHTEDLLKDPALVGLAKDRNLIIFCWGDDNADPGTIRFLKELGLHGVIYDKIYQYSAKEIKESIFMMEARESHKDLIRLAAANAEKPLSPTQKVIKDPKLDMEEVRNSIGDLLSTATSLESLESHLSDYEKSDGLEEPPSLK